MTTFEWTDNQDDPCGLCVQWKWDEEATANDPFHEKAIPYMPSGPVDRVWRGIHDDCADSVTMYRAEHQGGY